jgi:hypothetical protein
MVASRACLQCPPKKIAWTTVAKKAWTGIQAGRSDRERPLGNDELLTVDKRAGKAYGARIR